VPARAHAMSEEIEERIATLRRELAATLERTDRELQQVRDAAERLRLVPAAAIFDALERAARDAAVSVGKSVAFEARGRDGRPDADLLNALQGALVQAVRNAVAHGIEPPAARAAAGKPAEGRITIEVIRRGNRVAFLCVDDGAGVDVDA